MLRLLALALAPALVACASDEAPFDLEACDAPEAFRVTRVDLPINSIEARAGGLDLNGDDVVDNQLGLVIGTVTGLWQPPLEEHAQAHLAADVDWRVAVRRCPGDRQAIALHSAGTEPVYVVTEPGTPEARGEGGADLPLGTLFDGLGTGTDPGWISADFARIELGTRTSSELALRVGVGLDAAATTDIVAEAYAPYLDATLEDEYRDEVDGNGDGVITATELGDSSIVQSLLYPDLELRDDRGGISFGLPLVATPL